MSDILLRYLSSRNRISISEIEDEKHEKNPKQKNTQQQPQKKIPKIKKKKQSQTKHDYLNCSGAKVKNLSTNLKTKADLM